MKRCICILAASLIGCAIAGDVASSRLAAYFDDLPDGMDPATISRRVTDQFLTTRPENYKPAGYRGNNGYGHMDLYVTPVAQMVEMTAADSR